MEKLLIVDDNEEVRRQLKWGLSREAYELLFARDGEEALKLFRKESPGAVTLDLGLPPDAEGVEEGFRCLREMLRHSPSAKIIVITGNEQQENALQAVEEGAYDFYKKPIDLGELKVIINRAFHLHGLEAENRRLRSNVDSHADIVGQCPQMQQVFTLIDRVAASDAPVLVVGESGTGKELVAKALHARSMRAEGAMIAVNCGAIPENLLESELFGHEKGAFTGAVGTVKGKAEYADGGTLFLDEIGEMPPNMQVKLLRFLQDKVIQRVGGRKDIDVDVRIIAATNVDIQEAMQSGEFREDLYYRIGVVSIVLPPLRERGEDIMLLANFFLKRVADELGSKAAKFSPEAVDYLNGYEWPGNIRELENRVRRAVIMATTPQVTPEDMGFESGALARKSLAAFENTTLKEARGLLEKEMVEMALKRFSGNIMQAAKAIGVSRPTFYDLIKKHDIIV